MCIRDSLGLAFDVNPVAFTIGSFEFRWYGILIALGFILAFLYALKICKRYQVNQDHLIDCIIAGLILGIIGARLYYVIFYPGDMYWKDPIKILYINEGGPVSYTHLDVYKRQPQSRDTVTNSIEPAKMVALMRSGHQKEKPLLFI